MIFFMQLEKINEYRFKLKNKNSIPIIFHLSKELLPDEKTIEQLKGVANSPGAFSHVAALSDVHPKVGRKCPTGVAVASEYLLPQIMDTAPNCGMRMFALPLGKDDLNEKQIDNIFQKLIHEIPTKAFIGVKANYKTVMNIARYGVKGMKGNLKDIPFIENEEKNILQNGNEFKGDRIPEEKEILGTIPRIFLRLASTRLGILGTAGNHFLDLMKVDEIIDEKTAKLWGVKKDQLVFFMHTGSGILGQYASYFYTPKEEEHFSTKVLVNYARLTMPPSFLSKDEIKKLQTESLSYRKKKNFFSIDPKSKVGKAFWTAHRASANFGFANRSVLTGKVRRVVEKELGKNFNWKLIYDMSHVGVRQEEHFGKKLWIHRNGVSRAYGSDRLKDDDVLSQTGEPCFFAGSMTTPSYLAAAENENTSTFFSASHGAGKTKKIPKQISKKELFEYTEKNKVKLYNAQSKGIVQQASSYYKDINKVMEGVEKNKVAHPVAKLTPIAVLMA